MITLVQLEEAFPARKVAPAIERAFGETPAVESGVVHISRSAYNQARGQWDAEAVLAELEKKVPGNIVLGLFPHDIYVGGMNFVFGAAHLGGRAAVLSYHRLRPGGKESEDNSAEVLLRQRVAKEAIHELGHVLGVKHCRNEGCVMSFSPTLHWVDFKGKGMCKACAQAARDLLDEREAAAAKRI